MAPSPYQGIYCLIYICWGVAGWHHRLSLGVNCGSRGPARTAPVWSLSLYVFSFSSSDEPSIGAIHKRRDQFWDHPQTTSSLFSNIFTPPSPTSPLLKPLNYQMFPDIIPLIPWNMVTSFMDGPLSSKIIVKIVGVWQDEEGPDGKCFLEGVRHRHIFMWFEWMKIPGEAWRQLTPTPRLTARAAPRRLRHEYLEQLAVDLYHLFEPYLHTQGRPEDSLLKVQKPKDCILRALISSVFAQNNLIILFHFQMHNSCL